MSNYIYSLKSESPASLYVFDQNPPATVVDQGYAGEDLSLVETSASAKVVPGIIPGVRWSISPDVWTNDGASGGHVYWQNAAHSYWEDFVSLSKDWSIESTFVTGNSTRAGTGNRKNPIWAFADNTTEGVKLRIWETAGGWTLGVSVGIDSGPIPTDIITAEVERDQFIHAVVVNVESNFTLYVNGEVVGTGAVADTSTLDAVTADRFVVGGYNYIAHSNLKSIGSVALVRSVIPPNRIVERYNYLVSEQGFDTITSGYAPDFIFGPSGNGIAVLAPELNFLQEGAAEELETTSTGEVQIVPSDLAAPVTFYKKTSYDLTGIESIGRVYHDFSSTTGANSSVVAEYSFDDVSYSTLPTGEDAVPEVSQDWAQAGEGTL